jgi:hypothetical protein
MIVIDTYHPATLDGDDQPRGSSPVGGDQSKPGAWTQDEIDAWNRIKACAAEGHPKFWAMNPRASDDTCPGCNSIVRTVSTTESWGDHWAEQRAEERAYETAQREARAEDARW